MPQTGLTYYIDSKTGHLSSMIDNKESVIQAVFKALDTQKFEYQIYSWFYGLDMEPFIGQDIEYIRVNIRRYLEDCLLQDDRIFSIQNIIVQQSDIDSCSIIFDIQTSEGLIENITKEINYGNSD